jgi:hypothetical protein
VLAFAELHVRGDVHAALWATTGLFPENINLAICVVIYIAVPACGTGRTNGDDRYTRPRPWGFISSY